MTRFGRRLAAVVAVTVATVVVGLAGPVAAQPTTPSTTIPGIGATSTAADNPAQRTLVWIIGGLLALALVVLVVTIVFWRKTRPVVPEARGATEDAETPPRRREVSGRTATAVPSESGAGEAEVVAAAPVASIPPVRVGSIDALRDVPLWADEVPGDRPGPQ